MMTGINAVTMTSNYARFGQKGAKSPLEVKIKKVVNGSGATFTVTPDGASKTKVVVTDPRRGKLELTLAAGKLDSKAESAIRNHTAHK